MKDKSNYNLVNTKKIIWFQVVWCCAVKSNAVIVAWKSEKGGIEIAKAQVGKGGLQFAIPLANPHGRFIDR